MSDARLIITASPHIKAGDTTPRIMWHVVISLVPVIVSSAWFFGISALLVICLLYTSPSPRDRTRSRMPSSA